MASPDFLRFRASMNIGYDEWRDGTGYDLEALQRLAEDERELAMKLLLARHAADWRDIEALDCLGSPRALAEIEDALDSRDITVRIHAAEALVQRKLLGDARIEAIILTALQSTTILDGMVTVLRFAEAHPTDRVRQKLLWCARHGHDDVRVHAAALADFLYGHASSAFDAASSPLYLRFGSQRPEERQAALIDLCGGIGVDPASVA